MSIIKFAKNLVSGNPFSPDDCGTRKAYFINSVAAAAAEGFDVQDFLAQDKLDLASLCSQNIADISLIKRSHHLSRQQVDELVKSIISLGKVLEPISLCCVRREGTIEVVDGQHRLTAFKEAREGLVTIFLEQLHCYYSCLDPETDKSRLKQNIFSRSDLPKLSLPKITGELQVVEVPLKQHEYFLGNT